MDLSSAYKTLDIKGDNLTPSEFLDRLEESGLIDKINKSIFERDFKKAFQFLLAIVQTIESVDFVTDAVRKHPTFQKLLFFKDFIIEKIENTGYYRRFKELQQLEKTKIIQILVEKEEENRKLVSALESKEESLKKQSSSILVRTRSQIQESFGVPSKAPILWGERRSPSRAVLEKYPDILNKRDPISFYNYVYSDCKDAMYQFILKQLDPELKKSMENQCYRIGKKMRDIVKPKTEKIKRELKNITSSKAREVNRLKGNIDRHKHLIS